MLSAALKQSSTAFVLPASTRLAWGGAAVAAPVGSFGECDSMLPDVGRECHAEQADPRGSIAVEDRVAAAEAAEVFEVEVESIAQCYQLPSSSLTQAHSAALPQVAPYPSSELHHQLLLFDWNGAESPPDISSALSGAGSKEDGRVARGALSITGLPRCISATSPQLDQMEADVDFHRHDGHARSLPRAIHRRQDGAALGGRLAVNGGSDFRLGAVYSAVRSQALQVDDEDGPFRPPHEVAACPVDEGGSIAHSFKCGNRSIADRLKSVVFEQTGHVCSGTSMLLL